MNFITQIDFTILDFLHEKLSCAFLDYFFRFFTLLGNGGIVWFIAAAILLCSKKYRRGGIVMLCALALGFLTGNLIFKPLVARARPCWINDSVTLLISVPRDYSFPSGHTLSSVICCTVLMKLNRKFTFFALPLAVLIAFSRLYLYVHFPSDVLFSVGYGILIGILVFKLSKKYFPEINH